MAQFQFKKAENIRQKDKDIVYGFIRRVQDLFPKDNSYYIVSDLINHLCLLYFHHVIESELLTDDEQTIFMKLLRDNDKLGFDEKEWKLIYRASENGLNEKDAKSRYEYKDNLMCLFYTVNDEIFGGYTKTGWTPPKVKKSSGENYHYDNDPDAFMFLIRSKESKPFIIKFKNEKIKSENDNSLFSRDGYYLIWNGLSYINSTTNCVQIYTHSRYEKPPTGRLTADAKIKDIEVFQLL